MALDPTKVRAEFPALRSGAIFLDNPGGTQVPVRVKERMDGYLATTNANHGGAFATSRASDAVIDEARTAVADFLNARRPEEIVFGPNMTTLTFAMSRALAAGWQEGDEIVVTRLDHDANILPWTLAARDRGVTVRWLDIDVEDCTLRLDQLDGLLNERTRMVAVGYASNAVGTINLVPQIAEAAHRVGSLCYVDAVQYAPHGPIDVQALDCDFLVVSTYKFYGPHLGALYGKYERLEATPAYKVRPAPDQPPGKFETGTPNFEGIAGALGALEYLAEIGETDGAEHGERYATDFRGRRRSLKQAMAAIRSYETDLCRTLIETLSAVPGLRIYGIQDPRKLDRRVPTVSFTLEGIHPRQAAERLDQAGIYVWDGNYYALALSQRLGVEDRGGMIRVGLAHYNVREEILRLGEVLEGIASSI
ncbi:MAG TPA: cysteine desulfurase-like protein [Anaerolineales bacterium]